MARRQSRAQRWQEAIGEARAALEEIQGIAQGALSNALDDLRSVQEEYQEWRDNMPEGLDQSPTAEKLDEVVNLDMDPDLESLDISEIESLLDEAEGADLPLGFGRD